MKKFIAIPIITLLLLSNLYAEDRRSDKSRLIIMTLNAEFMWDGVDPEEGQVDFAWKHSQTEAEEHMQAVARIIIRSNADMVNLVEIENLEALNTLNAKFLQGRGYKPYFAKGKDTYTGQDMGLLTRIDPENNQIVYDGRKGVSGSVQKSVSKNYVGTFKINDIKMALIGLHFLSRPSSQNRKFKRQAQADAIAAMAIEKHAQGYSMVVLGDFNDYDGSNCCKDHVESAPITNVLSHIKSMSPTSGDDDLVNVAAFVPQSDRYTAFWDKDDDDLMDHPGEFTSIDHILLSPAMADRVEFADMPHQHDPRRVTDHYPVVVALKLGDGAAGPSASGGVRIVALNPNPAGNENQEESITIKNNGASSVNMHGWIVRDLAGRHWVLDPLGTLGAGKEKTIMRSGQPMALNNGGDTVELINPDHLVVHTVTYHGVGEEEMVFPAP
ncbi:MAG: lamin tail domain-containing protein [Desulfobacteraceae bacterium]|jgi:exonuclease III